MADDHDACRSGVVAQRLDTVVEEARQSLLEMRQEDGHWAFELEADATIPSEYILLEHFLGEIDDEVEAKLAAYLRKRQADHGGWPLFYRGDCNLSTSVKAYYALKLVGDDVHAPHMKRAREAILSRGGAARCNVFTRTALALFGQVPWRAVPFMPVEIMLLPRWFPFHLSKISYWSRTVIAPLVILNTLKPRAANPRGVGVEELFVIPPVAGRNHLINAARPPLGGVFLILDRVLRSLEPLFPKKTRRRAIQAAVDFVTERLNGEDGVGAIFPAMANTVMAFHALGYRADHPDFAIARKSVRRLLTIKEDSGYCQPCLSPIWDTVLAAHSLMEADDGRNNAAVGPAMDWLIERQVLDVRGDWAVRRPAVRPGGWPFQYRNDHYPDIDDTAVIVMALDRAGDGRYREAIERGVEWIIGMQSKDGGWGAFDADNTYHYLNYIPFADHGALLDPPTADVTARCTSMLVQLGYKRDDPRVARGLDFLSRAQEPDGSWYGRWGTNYIYGTWSVLCAFNAAGEDMAAPHIRKAVEWLKSRRREDGGWGEDGATYWAEHRAEHKAESKASTPSQTAWALLGLMAAGEVGSDAVRRGIEFLLKAPRTGGKWEEEWYTAVGFPRTFYLKYHGYSVYFPLWALARYRNLTRANATTVPYGI